MDSINDSVTNMNLNGIPVQTQPKLSEEKLKALQEFTAQQKTVNVVRPKRPDRVGLKSEVILETKLQNEQKQKLKNSIQSNEKNTNIVDSKMRATATVQQQNMPNLPNQSTSATKETKQIAAIKTASTFLDGGVNSGNINQWMMTTNTPNSSNASNGGSGNVLPKMNTIPTSFNFSQNLKSTTNMNSNNNMSIQKPTVNTTPTATSMAPTLPPTTAPVLFNAKVIQSNNDNGNSFMATNNTNKMQTMPSKDEKSNKVEEISRDNVSKPQIFSTPASSTNIFANLAAKNSNSNQMMPSSLSSTGNETFTFNGSKSVLSFGEIPQNSQSTSTKPLSTEGSSNISSSLAKNDENNSNTGSISSMTSTGTTP